MLSEDIRQIHVYKQNQGTHCFTDDMSLLMDKTKQNRISIWFFTQP
jgi:hypothetical protein